MRAANRDDRASYYRLLHELAPVLRGVVNRGFARYGLGFEDVEDVVQETLLALHLKRHTWDDRRPFFPWVRTIAQNKLVYNLRRRGHRTQIPLDDVSETLAADALSAEINGVDAERMIARLKGRQRDIVVAISIEGVSAREVGERFGMTEGAVRVALHRALQSLAKAFRADPA
jgi:RNA polymerase sigma-70 factor (ECF subfamily)